MNFFNVENRSHPARPNNTSLSMLPKQRQKLVPSTWEKRAPKSVAFPAAFQRRKANLVTKSGTWRVDGPATAETVAENPPARLWLKTVAEDPTDGSACQQPAGDPMAGLPTKPVAADPTDA